MKYWIFIATGQAVDGKYYTARQIYDLRMKDEFWGLGEATRHRKNLERDDQVVFYLGGNEEPVFGGTARLASAAFELTAEQQSQVAHGTTYFKPPYGVRLDAIDRWDKPKPVRQLLSSLKFIKNPQSWGVYFQGGIRQIDEIDYSTIASGIAPSEQSAASAQDAATQSLFALEAHLEEFIEHNWSKIDWGTPLDLYQEGDQTGRQFQADTWTIDFLAVDKKANEFVVIELKRGQTSDATIGQLLRYMSWVKKNIAKNRAVRGIIVANEVDEALRYAASALPNVSVKTYKVTFSLQAVDL